VAYNTMPSVRPADTQTPAPYTVLVVEDEVLVRLALAEYLRDCGFQVLEAATGDEAIEVLTARGEEVDLVFSDVQMPGKTDGFALAHWIRDKIPGMRIILTSGVGHAASKAENLCLDGPMIQKPYDHKALLGEIRRLQERARKNGHS